jgi:hypothetical protein
MPSPAATEAVRGTRVDARFLEHVLLGGLAAVFLVNALVAALQPSDFLGLIDRSLLGRSLPVLTGDWMTWAIGINDFLLGAGLVVAIWLRRVRPLILAWSGLWLLVVTSVKLSSLHVFGG